MSHKEKYELEALEFLSLYFLYVFIMFLYTRSRIPPVGIEPIQQPYVKDTSKGRWDKVTRMSEGYRVEPSGSVHKPVYPTQALGNPKTDA